jgi:hypothetical protein
MVAVPAPVPVTTPDVFTEPIVTSELLQVPPPVASLSVIFAPTQTDDGPLMVPIPAVTITGAAAKQPGVIV